MNEDTLHQDLCDAITDAAADLAAESQLFMETKDQISEDIGYLSLAKSISMAEALEIKKTEYTDALDRIIKCARHAKSSIKSIKA